jgi:hypothetical protein
MLGDYFLLNIKQFKKLLEIRIKIVSSLKLCWVSDHKLFHFQFLHLIL